MNLSRFLYMRLQGANVDLPVANGGGGGSQKSTTVNQMYSPEEAARRAALMAEAERLYRGSSTPPQQVPGAMSPETRQAQEMMRGLAGANPWAAMMGQLGEAQTFGFNAAMDPTSSPGFQSTLNTALRGVEQAYTGPSGPFAQIRQGFTNANSGGSGTREGIAMGMAGRDYLNTVGDVTGRLTSDAYTKGLDVFSRTLGLAPQTMAAMNQGIMMPANIIGGIGAQNEAFDEKQGLWNMNAPWMALQPYANAVMGMGASQSTTTQTTPGPQSNPMAPIGGAMMGASMAGMLGFTGPMAPFIGAGAGLVLSLFD